MIHKSPAWLPPNTADNLPLDAILRLLGQPMRRALLIALDGSDQPLAVADVSKEIVRRTSDRSREGTTSKDAKSCYISLQHRDIPKLAKYGIVTKHKERNTVELTDEGAELVRVIDDFVEEDRGRITSA